MVSNIIVSRLKRILPPLLLLIASVSLFASDAPRRAALLLGFANSNSFVAASERPFAAPFFASTAAATINTDKDDYRPGETVVISGSGWTPGETVRLQVVHIEPQLDSLTPHQGHEPWEVAAGGDGNVAAAWIVDEDSLNQTLLLTAEGLTSGLTASKIFTDSSVGTYDQCSNDDGDGYDTGDLGCQWTNGNLNGNNSTYSEGDSTVQRLWIEDFEPGVTGQTITLQYGTTKGSRHAYDFLTTWDHSEDWITVNDLCQAPTGASTNTIAGCVTAFPSASRFDIPDDPVVPNTFEPNGAGDREFVMAGANITAVSTPTPFSGTFPTGDNETRITITFDVDETGPLCAVSQGSLKCDIVLFFGAHISRTDDWTPVTGQGGATTIPGSPYHVALAQLNGASIGQRDNQMQASAIVLPAAQLTIVKEAFPEDAQNFEFQPSANLNGGTNFFLDDDGLGGDEACTGGNCLDQRVFTSLAAGTYSVAEINIPAGWALTGAVCSDGSPVNNIVLDSGENVLCTFTNRKPDAQIDLSPLTATNRVGEAHTITATVQQDDRYVAGAPGDAVTGFGPAPDGTTVNFSLLNNTAGASFVGPTSCQTVGGSCSVQINTTTAGSVDIRGTTTFNVIGVSLTRTTNSGGLNSADANKVYVDAQIDISPLTDTNPVNEAHTFTATVQQDDGLAAGAPGGDAVTGWGPAPNGTLVTFSFVQNTIGAVFVGGVNTCTTTSGSCTVQINSSAPGVLIVSATTTFNVGGLSMTRTTGTGGNNSANAQKTYVAGVIIVDKVTLPAGDPQLFTFTPSYGSSFQLADQTAPNNSGNLAPGTYSVAETVPAGWDLTSATCSDGSPVTAIVLGAGETVTCTFTNTKHASLTVVKATVPASDPQDFDFDLTGLGVPADLDLDTDAGDGTLPSQQTFNLNGSQLGAHTVIESVTAGWSLTNLVCIGAGDDSSTNTGTRTATLDIDAGETVTCTFTNTKHASLTVVKATVPSSDPQDFDFDLTGAGLPADLDLDTDAGDATLPSQQTFNLNAAQLGAHSVIESATAGWTLTNLVCVGAGPDSSTDTATRTATLDIDAGETVTCTFTNTKHASLTVVKATVPSSDPQDFDFDLTGAGLPADLDLDTDAGDATLPSQQTFNLNAAQLGAHSVIESATAGWTLTNLVCVGAGPDSSTDTATRTATLDIDAGETVTCTFTNTKDATVTIVKDAVPNDAQDFAFTTTGAGPAPWASFSLDDDGDGTLLNSRTFTFPAAQQGAKTVTEGAVAGWDLTNLSCSEGSVSIATRTASFTVDPGDSITCTFTNTKRGTIRVVKATNPAGAGGFIFTGDAAGTIGDGQSIVVSNLAPGTYTSTEAVMTGWVLTGIVCGAGGSVDLATRTATFNLPAGGDITCTFTNQRLPQLRLIKDIVPNTDAGKFDLRDNTVVKVDEGGDGADSGFFFTGIGSHTIDELAGSTSPTTLGDYVSKVDCDSGKGSNDPGTSHTFSLAYTEIVTCTFTNTRKASVQVIKTFQGGPITGPETFTFTLRTGASATESGTTMETQVANSTNGGTLNFATKLIPGQSYQICEVVMVGWSSSIGSLPGAFVIQTEPDGDNSTYCVAFTPTAGENVVITVDNTPPPDGDARTIGYWKNWSSCTRGNQAPVLDYILWSFAGGQRVEVELPLPPFGDPPYVGTNLGTFQVTDCTAAFNILSKRLASGAAKNGRSYASNAAVNMAAQLLAAKLNIQASADPSCIQPVITLADQYLASVGYNGTTAPSFPKATGDAMNFLAGLLDDYNNNTLSCPLPPLPPAP